MNLSLDINESVFQVAFGAAIVYFIMRELASIATSANKKTPPPFPKESGSSITK